MASAMEDNTSFSNRLLAYLSGAGRSLHRWFLPSELSSGLRQLFEGSLRLGVAGMMLQQVREDKPSLEWVAFQSVDPGQIEVGLIKIGRNPNALLKTRNGFISAASAQVEHAQVVEGFRVSGTGLEGLLKTIERLSGVIGLSEHHAEGVVSFGVFRPHREHLV